jgi:flap endonuclease-1
MGIKDLKKVLQEKAPDAFVDVPFTALRGKRLAIDALGMVYKFSKAAAKTIIDSTDVIENEVDRKKILSKTINMTLKFFERLLNAGITPIMVFDGPFSPHKKFELSKRNEVTKKLESRYEELMTKIKSDDDFFFNPEVCKELRSVMTQLYKFSKDEMKKYKRFFSSTGFPVMTAKHDGEALCASLVSAEICAAVYSVDTDVIAHGAEWMFDSWKTERTETGFIDYFCGLNLTDVLFQMKFSREKFVDLCILLGNDFNSNIYGKGQKRCLDALDRYESIEELEKSGIWKDCDFSVLNREICREIFSITDPSELIVEINLPELSICTEMFESKSLKRLLRYELTDAYKIFLKLFEFLPDSEAGWPEFSPKSSVISLK